MRVYLDASVMVALLSDDALTARADALLRLQDPVLLVSDFAAAEFASALGRRVRTGGLTAAEGRTIFAVFDAWVARTAQRVEAVPADMLVAEGFLRRLDLTLRTPDALNIAIARRLDATLASFDDKMAVCARALGVEVIGA